MSTASEWIEFCVGPTLGGLGRPRVLVCVRGAEDGYVAEAFVVLRKPHEPTFDLTFMEVAVSQPAGVFADAGVCVDRAFVTDRMLETVREFVQQEQIKVAPRFPFEWEYEQCDWRAGLCRLKLDGAPPHLLEAIRETSHSEEVGRFIAALTAAPQPFTYLHGPTRRSFGAAWKKYPGSQPSEV